MSIKKLNLNTYEISCASCGTITETKIVRMPIHKNQLEYAKGVIHCNICDGYVGSLGDLE